MIRARPWTLLLAGLLGTAGACSDGKSPTEGEAEDPGVAYVNAALDIMEAHSIKRYEVNWPTLRGNTLQVAGPAPTQEERYAAVRYAIAALGDNHSYLIVPSGGAASAPAAGAPAAAEAPFAMVVQPMPGMTGLYGYVSVPAFSGSGDAANALATEYHRLIEGVDTMGVCGWIVDLRGNTGGNMWPMVAGLGPILGEGVLGYFVDPDSVVTTWTYADGASMLDGQVLSRADPSYTLRQPDPPVAVLADGATASSGEAAFIAFKGRPDTWSTGVRTAGLSTANRAFPLSDGAILVLTVSTMADRTGQIYGGRVTVDHQIGGPATLDPGTDSPFRLGMAWLGGHERCAGSGS